MKIGTIGAGNIGGTLRGAWYHVPALPDDLFAGAADTIVVDTGNYYPQ
ncbi:MAG TPA: hypothetical protein VN748_21420 [Pseudonocardiaceae bacterium]|jgi:hypothetical protein|nr:hypothetical protein [Pseudonocardiaceae bacterium]